MEESREAIAIEFSGAEVSIGNKNFSGYTEFPAGSMVSFVLVQGFTIESSADC